MLIRSIIRRKRGNTVCFDGTLYQFPPEVHTCEVADKAHIKRFLAIPEGYEIDESEMKTRGAKVATKKKEPEPAKPEPQTHATLP
jgi:hypothetical protein